jgi:hypothetical protein
MIKKFTLFSVALLWATISFCQNKVSKEELVGTWALVLVDNIAPDGSRTKLYGPEPKGILVFDAHGNYSLQIMRKNRTKFSANDKAKGTAEENESIVKGTNTHFGKYSVNEADQTITFQIETAFFPNWEGTSQKRTFTIVDNVLKYDVPVPTTGGAGTKGEVAWRKMP